MAADPETKISTGLHEAFRQYDKGKINSDRF